MKYLIDTHTLLWIISDDTILGENTRSIYLNENNEMYLSTASLWEMAIKISLGKLKINSTLPVFIENYIQPSRIKILPIELKHIYLLENLQFFHRDPFDRMIISQAIVENLPVLSNDKAFDAYSIQRIW